VDQNFEVDLLIPLMAQVAFQIKYNILDSSQEINRFSLYPKAIWIHSEWKITAGTRLPNR